MLFELSCQLGFPDVSIKVSANDSRDRINAIKNVSPPAHLPTYRKVPKKNTSATAMLGVSLCIKFKPCCDLLFSARLQSKIIRFQRWINSPINISLLIEMRRPSMGTENTGTTTLVSLSSQIFFRLRLSRPQSYSRNYSFCLPLFSLGQLFAWRPQFSF